MIKYLFITIIFSLFVFTTVRTEVIKSGSLQAFSDGVNITLRWATENENKVLGFEILRSTDYNGGFISIGKVNPKGNSIYEFVDYTAFKRTTTVYYYRIKVKLNDGEIFYPALNEAPLTVNHSVSGVRRTWGSIKALFR